MYFPLGWPKIFNGKLQTGLQDVLKVVRFNRSRSLFVTISDAHVYLWKTCPRVILAVWNREEKCIYEQGKNQDVFWNPDSSMLAIVTEGGFMILLDIFEVEKEFVYYLEPVNPRHTAQQLQHNGLLKVELSHRLTLTLKGKITSVSPRIEELFITTTEGWLHRLAWSGTISSELAVHIGDLLFCVDLETPTVGSPLAKDDKVYISKIECSPVLGGFAIVLSDGRGGFLSSSTADAKPEEIIGVFAKDLNNASSLAVNIKYQIIVFGLTDGKAIAYTFDDMTGGLIVSHKYILPKEDYPGEGSSYGSIKMLSWTPDGCALATMWSNSGIAVWSVFGALLMCVQSVNYGGESFRHNALPLTFMAWGFEGYELLLLPNIIQNEEKEDVSAGDIISIKFVKSALAVNPCMSNRQHLFLQGDDCVYLNNGDVMLQTTQGAMLNGSSNGINSPSMHFSNKHWQTFQVPNNYIKANWPIRYAAIDDASQHLAVAGVYGYAHFSLARRKWKLFRNETQENSVTCRGGLTWWQNFLIVGCYYFQEEVDEVRLHNRHATLDVSLAYRIKVTSPIFIINTYNNILLVYCSDCSVSLYKLTAVDNQKHVSGIDATKVSETTLIEYLIHPITVTSLSLTGLRHEQSAIDESSDSAEAHSLIANIAGRVVMLQKDKPAAERVSEIQFLAPVVLASCVENIWYMVNPLSSKQHLSESLWLACGAQGMQAWLPLFPTCRPLGFLSKRIMLHLSLQLYPLAVLFEDAVIIGIGNDDIHDCLIQSPLFGTPMPFPYFNLQRTTQVYLPQILKQLLRRNLGDHALDIARSCTNLPYFTHVLELMLHEVLEKEATASNPIPDPLLPRIVAFIQEFPQFLETVCHCARKTEFALWQHLFSAVGDPIDLFKSCHTTGKLETAASYLLIIQSLETPAASRHHATLLLESALEEHKWELARDLVRFLRAIGKGDNESPPRTPVYFTHKSSFHQTLSTTLSSSNLDDSLPGAAPVMIPIQRQTSRSNMPATTVSRTTSTSTKERAGSITKERASSIKEKCRPTNLKLSRRETEKVPNSSSKPSTLESCEHFYTEMILSRHARKLLIDFSLHDLATFAAHLEFDLVNWLIKERFRAAVINNFTAAFIAVHEQFDWPFPSVASNANLRPNSPSEKEVVDILTPSTPLDSEVSYPCVTGDDIEARLVSIKDDILLNGAENASDTSSMVTYDEHCTAPLVEVTFPDMNDLTTTLLESRQMVPPESLDKLKYILKIFVEARCFDWVIIVGLMLFDFVSLNEVVKKVDSFKDLTKDRLKSVIQHLNLLSEWLEGNCPAYQPILNTIVANIETLMESVNEENELSKNSVEIEEVKEGCENIDTVNHFAEKCELDVESESISADEAPSNNNNAAEEVSECIIS